MEIAEYIQRLNKRYKSGISREHSYRGDLQSLIETISPDVLVTNEPAHIACGAPDYIITKRNIPIGYIEAKDIGKPLDSKEYKEQFDRYKKSLDNLIITDYLDFWLYRDSEFITSIKIACIESGKIVPVTDNFDSFSGLIKDFCTYIGQTIKSASKLSKMMAGKAKLLANVIENALIQDESDNENLVYESANITLREQLGAFKNILIHDITAKDFADIYAQTISYGMFAARLHDPTLEDFSRQEAAELIPKSNPFLRRLFQYIAGYDLDDRIKWIVDALADIFRATDVASLLKDFGKLTHKSDPIIHFYETFLAEYNPKLRKSRGVWYTPEPVVNFIVRAVDDILKTEFGLSQGLADTSKTTIEIDTQSRDKRSHSGYKKEKVEVHKVQILDPAAGTGTFLAEVVKQIYKNFEGQEGIWSNYVEKHLLPRLNGFEILMASYAMAHLKLELLLRETGYKPNGKQRLRIYLTNSLEEHHPDTGTLFASWLSKEANEANHIKRDTPVMCVIGNPPYSGISSNKGKWISDLIEDYKYVDGVHFNERKHWLNDDYVKFIRYGQHFIEKNGSGVLAFINPHGFLDNPTFRGMRWNLLRTYDKIYTIDLHGNSNKKEVSPDGSSDVNVFDIQQGVSINIFVKTGEKTIGKLGKVFQHDIYGKRLFKYDFLENNSISKIEWNEINPSANNYSFKNVDSSKKDIYISGFELNVLFKTWTTGVQTSRDKIALSFNENETKIKILDFCNDELSTDYIRSKYFIQTSRKYPAGDTRDWKLNEQRIKSNYEDLSSSVINYTFRPFDSRLIIFDENFISWPRMGVSKHLLNENISLILARSNKKGVDHFFISDNISDVKCGERTTGSIFCPLYLYPESNGQQTTGQSIERTPNLNAEILKQMADKLGLTFTKEKENTKDTFAPMDILDYIYAILHSPTYREKYKEFLKIDFPRVPYPKDRSAFWKFVKLGGELRQIHLLESSIVEKYITTYPQDGNNTITRRIRQKDFEITDDKKGFGRVWVNDEQYFDKVPVIAWEFYIGGYQPAQKWLKDRHSRTLSYEDIMHYQKIIVALTETDRLMKEIDKIGFE